MISFALDFLVIIIGAAALLILLINAMESR